MKSFKEFLTEQSIQTEAVVYDEYITRKRDKFFIDREDIDSGDELVKPGDKITFKRANKKYKAVVSSKTHGRDDDVYELKDVMEV